MLRDPTSQTYVWSGFSSILSYLTNQHNLVLLSLAIGIVTALINAYAKWRDNARKEEIHQIRKARLKMGLPDEIIEDD